MTKLTPGDWITLAFGSLGFMAAGIAFVTSTQVNSAELIRLDEKIEAVEVRSKESVADVKVMLRRMEDKLDRILTQR